MSRDAWSAGSAGSASAGKYQVLGVGCRVMELVIGHGDGASLLPSLVIGVAVSGILFPIRGDRFGNEFPKHHTKYKKTPTPKNSESLYHENTKGKKHEKKIS